MKIRPNSAENTAFMCKDLHFFLMLENRLTDLITPKHFKRGKKVCDAETSITSNLFYHKTSHRPFYIRYSTQHAHMHHLNNLYILSSNLHYRIYKTKDEYICILTSGNAKSLRTLTYTLIFALRMQRVSGYAKAQKKHNNE